MTDGSGQFTVVDLRPGTYTVTFTLPGFSTVRREGIVLTGNFVATVNADLRVGAVEETITVTGETPIVDVQSTKQQQVMDAELIAAIPTGRSLANLAVLIPGVIAWSPRGLNDVGGTDNLQNTYMSIHGGRAYDQRTLIDGIAPRQHPRHRDQHELHGGHGEHAGGDDRHGRRYGRPDHGRREE